ncbi:MAG: hypothetical protein QW193_01150 [Nitrososphaerales archaeon]
MSESIEEVKINATLTDGNKEVATVEQVFGLVESQEKEETETPTRTIDETMSEFFREIQAKAEENGYSVSKEVLTEATISTILFLIKHEKPELELDIPLIRPKEEKEDVNREDTHT